jgi:hypothetical protein
MLARPSSGKAPGSLSASLRLCGETVAALVLLAAGCGPRDDAPQPYAVGLVRAEGRTGVRLAVRPGTVAILDGGESGWPAAAGTRPAGDPLVWRWRQLNGPRLQLARADLASIECRPTAEGLYIFSLVVSSGKRESLPALVEVEVRRDAPAAPDGPGEAPPAGPPAGPGADFALLESSLDELIRVFPAKTGITLRVDTEWLRPEAFRERQLSFMARRVPPEVALELAARLAGGHFVRDGKDSAMLSAGCGWLRGIRQEARFYPAPTGLIPADGTAKAFEELLRGGCRAALFACPDASAQWQPGLSGVNVVGPESLHARARELMTALTSREASPPAEPPATGDEKLRGATLARPVGLRLVGAEFPEAALELGRILGAPVAWEESTDRPRRPLPRVSVDGRNRPAAEVLAEVARQAGFKGCSWVRGGALWFFRSEPRAGSAESAWSQVVVRSYPAKWLESRGVLPGAFILAAKKRVCPESWSESAALLAYYRETGRILVINTPEAQDGMVRLMYELTRKTGS